MEYQVVLHDNICTIVNLLAPLLGTQFKINILNSDVQ